MLTHRHATIIGDIPDDWEARPLRRILAKQAGGDWGDDEGEQEIRVVRSTNFTDSGYLDFADVETRCFREDKAAQFALKQDDILLERSGGGPTQPVGRIGIVESDLPRHWFSNFVQLLRANRDEIEPQYLAWVLFELNRSGIVERLQHQTTQMRNLDFRDYIRVLVPRPPRNEQQQVAVLIANTSKSIEKTKLKLSAARRLKIALMQQLFTRGLPGRHTRFHQTKIGELPEGWEILPLAKVASVVSGIALNTEREPRFNPRQYLTVIHVQRERLDLTEVRYLELFPNEIPRALLEEGDILVVEGHANASEIGRAALATLEVAEFAYQNHLFRVRLLPDASMDRLFLLGVLNSERVRRHWVAVCNTSSGLNTINHRGLRRLLIQRPRPDEQEEIAALLSAANQNIAACQAELQALDRLKRSLLQNLLTGRVRVRSEL